jgi:hypothetical protein
MHGPADRRLRPANVEDGDTVTGGDDETVAHVRQPQNN